MLLEDGVSIFPAMGQPNDDAVQFWEGRFQAHKTPWDLGGSPSALKAYVNTLEPGRVLIPGCGYGWEIRTFEEHGWAVTAIDLAPSAIERVNCAKTLESTEILLGDFFEHDFTAHRFDIIYERTFLCALGPHYHESYLARMLNLLAHDGLLAGYFFYGQQDDPPPHPLRETPQECFLSQGFELLEDRVSPDAIPLFEGERWQIWRPRAC